MLTIILIQMLEGITVELGAFLVSYITTVVGILRLSHTRYKKLQDEYKTLLAESIRTCQGNCDITSNLRMKQMESTVAEIKRDETKTSEKVERLDEKIERILINIAEIKTFLKGNLNGNSNKD